MEKRPLGRWTHYLADARLWHITRRSIRRALAVGFLCAFLIPIGQFALAAALSIPLRANVPLAVLGTLVTNPFTFPFTSYAALVTGRLLLPGDPGTMAGIPDWMHTALSYLGPIGAGLLAFSVIGGIIGWVAGELIWRADLARRRRRRQRRHHAPAG